MSLDFQNFRIYVDRKGRMPVLSYKKWNSKTHPFYTRYQNNHPVGLHGPTEVLSEDITKTKVYSYAKHEFVSIVGIPQE